MSGFHHTIRLYKTELQSHPAIPLSDQPIVARLQYIPTYAQKIRTHSSFAREMATEPQSKTTRLAEICNRLGSAESLLSSTQLETDKSVDEFLQAEIALSAVQEALRIAQEFFDRAEAKMRTLAFRSGDLNLKREIEELKTEEICDSFRFDWRKKATGPG